MTSECSDAPQVLAAWYETNKHLFGPPICNKLMHKKQLTVMFVGGPNQRRDFHLDRGSEFFYQMRGNIKLPTIQQGKLKIVEICEGDVFLLPSCVPHSPQRPEEGALGLVVERERFEDELDGLRYFTGFFPEGMGNTGKDGKEAKETTATTDEILWERFFYCNDLGRDLVPVVTAFKESEEAATNKPRRESVQKGSTPLDVSAAFPINTKVSIPDPMNLKKFLQENRAKIAESGKNGFSLFGKNHPDKEFSVMLYADGAKVERAASAVEEGETFAYMLEGEATLTLTGGAGDGKVVPMPSDGIFVVEKDQGFKIDYSKGSIGWLVTVTPRKNEKFYGYSDPENWADPSKWTPAGITDAGP